MHTIKEAPPTEKVSDLETQMTQAEPGKRRKVVLAILFGLLICCFYYPLIRFSSEDWTGLTRSTPTHTNGIPCQSARLSALGQSFARDSSFAESNFIDAASVDTLNESLYQYTKHPHLAGTLALAEYTRDKWQAFGVEDVKIVQYDVLLNSPTNRSQVSLLEKGDIIWRATLKEDVLPEDPGSEEAVPFFHGYSKNGSAQGALVYLNYARPEDFRAVAKSVKLEGKIGIARYGQLFRGLKVELAQQHGMSAILLYDDPSEDRNITIANGYEPYPHGPARNPSSVQRGSVQFLSVLPGDPTTPGYASVPGCKRQDPYKSIPGIPSIPISVRDAEHLLRTLNGHGVQLPGFSGAFPDVHYNVGGSKNGDLQISLDNVVDYDFKPIYNVIAKIPGHFDESIILGNHRDAWVRGASDPNSGSAALDSIIGTFASLQQAGYVPLRSLVFASWDAEEYGLVGSTEWVEEHASELSANVMAYLNVDVASSGIDFKASASPFLFDVLRNVTRLVPSVHNSSSNSEALLQKTLHDDWHGHISTLGSGSDYTAFQDALGITSVDMGFSGGKTSQSVYHYHSQYDSYHWLTTVGDPGLRALQASTRLWGLLAYRLAEQPVIGFNATTYGIELERYISDLDAQTVSKKKKKHDKDHDKKHGKKHHKKPDKKHKSKELKHLKTIVKGIKAYGRDLDARALATNEQVKHWADFNEKEKLEVLKAVQRLNEEYKHFERALLDPKGLKDRPFFKHVLFAPGRWTGYAGSVFPSITEAKNHKERKHAIERVTRVLKKVGKS